MSKVHTKAIGGGTVYCIQLPYLFNNRLPEKTELEIFFVSITSEFRFTRIQTGTSKTTPKVQDNLKILLREIKTLYVAL